MSLIISVRAQHISNTHASTGSSSQQTADLVVHHYQAPPADTGPAESAILSLMQLYIMPPMPPMPPGAPAGSSLGISVTITSVVVISPETDAASSSAVRTTLSGSITPAFTMFSYTPLAALKPTILSFSSSSLPTITDPSSPAFDAMVATGLRTAVRTIRTTPM